MQKLIISAPFGNYFNYPFATSTIGTFTLNKRAGPIKRFWRVIKTVRYYPKMQSWINKLGLPNPGINSIIGWDHSNCIISIHGFNFTEWMKLINICGDKRCEAVELNLSCPNVTQTAISEMIDVANYAYGINKLVIAKLSPIKWMEIGRPLYNEGIKYFHLCNTISTPGGGLSGKILKSYSLNAIQDFRQKWGDQIKIIGGGGITCLEDVKEYMDAGADHVSIASMLFNPFNWNKPEQFTNYLIQWS